MKYTILKPLLFITLLFYAFVASAQSGAVYSFLFYVDPELTDFVKVERNNKKWFSGYSSGEIFPEELIDSIKIKTEKAFTDKLQMPVKMCFHRDKRGRIYTTEGLGKYLDGIPRNSFKGAKVDCPENNRYIRLYAHISNEGNSSVAFGNSNTKPNLRITAVVFDENKNKVWKKKIEIKDFAELRSVKRYYGIFDVTESEVLNPIDIYAIYNMGLEELMNE